jgi:hypothetical protein
VLERSERRLNEINRALRGSTLASTPPGWVSGHISAAADADRSVIDRLRDGTVDVHTLRERIEHAMWLKSRALAAFDTPSAAGSSECSDGKDNDGDRLVDGRVDSGCTRRQRTGRRARP